MAIKIGSTQENINSAGGLIPAGKLIKTDRGFQASDAVGSMIPTC